jgi:DNA repair protein RadC
LDEQLRTEDIFTSPEKVMDYLAIQMRDNHREVFAVMLLDTRHRLIELIELFFGTISSASVHPREVAKAALEKMHHLLLWRTIIQVEVQSLVVPTF